MENKRTKNVKQTKIVFQGRQQQIEVPYNLTGERTTDEAFPRCLLELSDSIYKKDSNFSLWLPNASIDMFASMN